VAAHLEPEILLVDEVLAVGDINFQKKSLGRMGEVAKGGRTVVLVSHQLNQIRRLCHRVVWVDGATVRRSGPTHEVVSAYESAMARGNQNGATSSTRLTTKGRFLRWEIGNGRAESRHQLNTLGPVTIRFHLELAGRLRNAIHGVALYSSDRQLIWGTASYGLTIEPGLAQFSYDFGSLPLRPGAYSWLVSLFDDSGELDMWDAVPDMVVATEPFQHPRDEWSGLLNIPAKFSIGKSDENQCD
jgi:hypothetical protein